MKIAVTGTRGFPGIQGGVENHCEHLYSHMVKLDCDITVFTRKPYITYQSDEYKGIKLVALNCPKNKFLETIIHTYKSILQASKLMPDILHIHAIGPSLFAPLARALGMQVIVTHHGPDYMRKKWRAPAKIFLKFCERMGMMFAHDIIAISKNISNDIERKYNRKSTVLPNGIDVPEVAVADEGLKRFGLKKRKYILAVGRLVPEKGLHDLIEAYLSGEYKDYKLAIAGDADHQDKYSGDLKLKAKASMDIVLTGFITGQPLRELFSHAALFILPSYHEGLPIALLEAMSYGLPCIASDIPANRNIALGDKNYFIPGDVEAMSLKIHEFINLQWDETAGNKQKNMITESYNWGNIAKETLKVYKKNIR